MDFDGLDVVVTGGTGQLGTEVSRVLLSARARVHIPVFNAAELAAFPLAGDSRIVTTPAVDLSHDDAVARYFGALPGLWASIHIAGGFAMSPVAETSRSAFMAQIDINATTCFLACREAVKRMRSAAKGGRIVNVSARPALEPRAGAGMIPYTAAKAAVAAITQALAEEVAADGILVNAVVPSIIDTAQNRADMPGADHAKWPKPDDIARTIAFLASPANKVTRGGLVPVYGLS